MSTALVTAGSFPASRLSSTASSSACCSTRSANLIMIRPRSCNCSVGSGMIVMLQRTFSF
uniref:Uncharacterized protein n=1 Tax=Arundo donax TaxID=35708 RepID=A0A0A9DNA2_ARUDO